MNPTADNPSASVNPEQWVEAHGDALFGYALMRVRDPTRAEDLVQDTLLAAFRGRDAFSGLSTERTWLIGILRHKLLDFFRRSARETSFTDLEFLADEHAEKFETGGPLAGAMRHESGPLPWRKIGDSLDNELFWRVFSDCAAKLPERVGVVFVMREVDELESDEICETLAISPGNLWVMLHRARMALRDCVENNWFKDLAK